MLLPTSPLPLALITVQPLFPSNNLPSRLQLKMFDIGSRKRLREDDDDEPENTRENKVGITALTFRPNTNDFSIAHPQHALTIPNLTNHQIYPRLLSHETQCTKALIHTNYHPNRF